jgi:YVTN family beta-propeller protein
MADDLPRGAVTFLFTDIEGSTRLVRQLRDRYGEVLAEHQRLLREAFAAHGGHEIDTQGDSFFYAFASAREAVQAAIEGQRALSGYPWPDGNQVKVRMGIHTGQAAPVDGRDTGLAVHRAARIQAAAHGGQVLVSQATQSLLEDEEEDLAVGLRDLGEQRLKDIERPVRLYQVAAPGLPHDFPPPRREEEAPAAAPTRRAWLSPRLLIVAGVVAVLVIVPVVALLAARGGGGGLGEVPANNVGLIDPSSNDVVASVPVGIRPGPVAVQPGGPVWIGNLDDRTLTKVDPKQRTNVGTLPLASQTPTGIAVGFGAVWVAHGRLGSLSRVDAQFGNVAKTIPLAGRSEAGSVGVGEGAVWAVYGDSTLARVNPHTTTERGSGYAGATPSGIVVASGSVWVANSGEADVYQFNPSTFTSGRVHQVSVGRDPEAIAFGADSLWVANSGQDTVTQIDVASSATTTIPVGHRPSAIAFGEGGVWVANEGDGTVSRIDPASATVVKTIHTGNAPAGIAVGDGYVWVTVQAP